MRSRDTAAEVSAAESAASFITGATTRAPAAAAALKSPAPRAAVGGTARKRLPEPEPQPEPDPPSTPPSALKLDLRSRSAREAGAARLLARADSLPADELALLRAVYHDGVKIASLAAMTGTSVSVVRTRLRRIVARLESPTFAFVVTRRDAWPAPMRRVATACFLHGHPLRRAAGDLGMSVATVRRYRDAVEALIEAHARATPTRTITTTTTGAVA